MDSLNILVNRRCWLSKAALATAIAPALVAIEVRNVQAADQAATEIVFNHHLAAFAKGLNEVMADYTNASVVVTPDATHTGLSEIGKFFQGFLATATPEFWAAFKVVSSSVHGDVAYLVWSSVPAVALATDTLLVREGKILVQTFTPFSK
jgi:hypothetical protein